MAAGNVAGGIEITQNIAKTQTLTIVVMITVDVALSSNQRT